MTRLPLAALLLVVAACGGDDSLAPAPSDSPTPGATATGGAGTLGPTPSVSVEARHGSAEVTFRGVSRAWEERACESVRGLDGKVVGWLATFQDVTEQTQRYRIGVSDSQQYVQLRVRGYRGDGSYESAEVAVRYVGDSPKPALVTGFGSPGQTLTIREDGHEGTYKSKDLTVSFDCDPADETSTEAGPSATEVPEPGTAYVVRPEGAFRFDRVRCTRSGAETQVMAGAYPHFFRLLTRAKPAAAGTGRLLLSVHGVVLPSGDDEVEVEVAGDPVRSGRFRYSPGGPNAGGDVTRGAFTCG